MKVVLIKMNKMKVVIKLNYKDDTTSETNDD